MARGLGPGQSGLAPLSKRSSAVRPLLWEYGGLSFVALQTEKALHAEGAAMHHCVASYWGYVVDGECAQHPK